MYSSLKVRRRFLDPDFPEKVGIWGYALEKTDLWSTCTNFYWSLTFCVHIYIAFGQNIWIYIYNKWEENFLIKFRKHLKIVKQCTRILNWWDIHSSFYAYVVMNYVK